ncbi:MAG: heat-inducible transcriptional repressor HrcA [Deltaproteobacteria bacterium]|nr:heat-inducible transcriptional repressor HrcA [Deltaproteobacteria bacterium]
MTALTERHQQVLRAVVDDHVVSSQPVGSATLSRRYLDLSPATVRNVMGDLERMGLLHQPHTSAGRVPTDRGFRLYVDDLLKVRNLSQRERDRIRAEFESGLDAGDDVMRRAGHLLSAVSNLVGLVLAPPLDEVLVKRIELVRLGRRRAMIILITDQPVVHNRVVRTDADYTKADLEKMARYLNETVSGCTLGEMYARIEAQMKSDRVQYDRLRARALRLGLEAFGARDEGALYVEEATRLLEQPEFLDIGRMKALFRTLEEKSQILALLRATIESEGVNVLIGSESEVDGMQGCTLITSRYTAGRGAAGSVGVIGPTRMDYRRIIPLVGYVANLLSRHRY